MERIRSKSPLGPLREFAARAGLTPELARRLLLPLSSNALRRAEAYALYFAGLPEDAHPIQLFEFVVNDWRAGLLHTLDSEPHTPFAFTPTIVIAAVLAAQLYVYTDDSTRVVVPDTRLSTIRALAREPELIYGVNPYRFEELVAFLEERFGLVSGVTRKSADAGVDVLVWHPSSIAGSPLRAIQAKLWRPDNKVGIEEVQRMKGVVIDFGAQVGEIVTTSYFTENARWSAGRGPVPINLVDFTELQARIHAATNGS